MSITGCLTTQITSAELCGSLKSLLLKFIGYWNLNGFSSQFSLPKKKIVLRTIEG